MTPFRDLPIRHKLVIMTVATSAAALLVIEGGFLAWDMLRFRSDVRLDIEAQGQIVAENSAAALAFADEQAAGETLAALALRPQVTMACLYETGGRLFATYHRDASVCPTSPPPPRFGWATLDSVTPVINEGTQLGTLYVQRDLSDLYQRLRVAIGMALALLVLAGIAAVLLAIRIQRSISAPLLELAAAAGAITNTPGYARVSAPASQDEIGVVIRAFNRMVDRIESHTNELSRTNEELQNANRLKDEFLATLSHELRTPLNAVLGWTRVLRSTNADAALQARALDSIERNALAQTRLIEDLLEISRIVTGKLRLQIREVDLAAIVDAAIEVVLPAAAAKRIRIDSRIDVRPALTSGDPDRLQQVVWNLISNAVKFTPEDGVVTVRLWRDRAYHLTVRDTGMGIEPRFLPFLFEAFRQADGSPSREHGGLGLGLAIARQLVEAHGGTIDARSEGPGTGSTFMVTLPSVIGEVPAEPAPASSRAGASVTSPSMPLHGLHVLVVDDEPDARALLDTMLTRYGARVTTAASAAEALAALAGARPDVLLSDIGMPNEDGYALVRELRSRPREAGGNTPAIALTAYASASDRERALAAGFQEHMAKPFDPDALAGAVARLGRAHRV